MTRFMLGTAVAALIAASPASAQILSGGGGSLGGTIGGSIDRVPIDTVTRTRTGIRADREIRSRRPDRRVTGRVTANAATDSAARIGERRIVTRSSADAGLTLEQRMLRTRGAVGAMRRGMRRAESTSAGVSVFVPRVAVVAPATPRVVVASYPSYSSAYYYGPDAVFVSSGHVDRYMDGQYQEILVSLEGSGATVHRRGEDLVVTVPADVTFAFDRSDIRGQFHARLAAFARALNAYPGSDIQVIGHTDSMGSETYNIALSERRGRSVADFLVAQGVDPARLVVEAMGESQPIATNATVQGRAANRRVEFVIHPRAG
ncbi:OmpA family protein [Sphingomonas canadensis]|uniref:OmpA family protein n=1 Tax=Sphingomonas canadensis TaxID=1219257 RepID=A0ABW3H8K0_9SPHN|nr:OmpA family protein [Sphingomonas canadensis]MCW3834451.1 OmpA family protein [Sphingomonas canadensis]